MVPEIRGGANAVNGEGGQRQELPTEPCMARFVSHQHIEAVAPAAGNEGGGQHVSRWRMRSGRLGCLVRSCPVERCGMKEDETEVEEESIVLSNIYIYTFAI